MSPVWARTRKEVGGVMGRISIDRRKFIAGAGALAASGSLIGARSATADDDDLPIWNSGAVRHMLPAASHNRLLLKLSLEGTLPDAPLLRIDGRPATGTKSDSAGAFWSFDVGGLSAATEYGLELETAGGDALCDPWPLRTFPAPDQAAESVRLLVYTCAGGHDIIRMPDGGTAWLSMSLRRRLLDRALSFAPDIVIANGDHVYWDLHGASGPGYAVSPAVVERVGEFDPAGPVMGSTNELVLKRAVDPQIASLYGTRLRSTPVFFIQDDHDYFENDMANDRIVTMPPNPFLTELGRTSQKLWYPEFIADETMPVDMPGLGASDRAPGLSETAGRLRYGKLLELLFYDCRRHLSLNGPSGQFVADRTEAWILDRMSRSDADHVINMPSTPPGWTAGKWAEWYPDVLVDGGLTIEEAKPYWQAGWFDQHNRILEAIASMRGRIPLILGGDLHATGLTRITRSGELDLSWNPVLSLLPGALGTGDPGWPSAFRGTGAIPSGLLAVNELLSPVEQNGFTIIDVMPDAIEAQMFLWYAHEMSGDEIDRLEPAHYFRMPRPV